LIRPPHLLNVVALLWEKLITSFEHFGCCLLRQYVDGSEKKQLFGAEMRIQAWKWPRNARFTKF